MTLLNATLTTGFGVIVQDAAVTDTASDQPIGQVDKIVTMLDQKVIAAGCGSLLALRAWQIAAPRVGLTTAEIADATPELLRAIVGGLPADSYRDFTLVMIGFTAGSLAGWAFQGDNDFRPEPIVPNGGHLILPCELDTADRDYSDLVAMSAPAAVGLEIERFHAGLALNQHSAQQRGLLRSKSCIGGPVTMAHIDQRGVITKREIARLPTMANEMHLVA